MLLPFLTYFEFVNMNSDEISNFINNYQYIHFQDTPDDPLKSAYSKRTCLAQSFIAGDSLADETTTNSILQENLQEYSNLVDDQSGINNYASSIQALTLNLNKTECKQWKNELSLADVDEIIQSLNCCTHNDDLVEDNLNVLFEQKVPPQIVKPNLFPTKSNIPDKSSRPASSKVEDNFVKVNETSCNNKNTTVDTQQQSNKRDNFGCFKTARDELQLQNAKKNNSKQNGSSYQQQQQPSCSYGAQKKSLGARRGVQSKFVPPVRTDQEEAKNSNANNWDQEEEVIDERLKNIDPRMVELIRSEIMDSSATIGWDDIAGLEFAKTIIKEVVVWPLLRPDIFTGLRRPPKGILLFGPPGTGKTLIGKCIASSSQSTFFSISASSLTSKWIGDGEKMVRAMFAVARCHQPAVKSIIHVIFIDEIDSMLSQRSDTEHESSRRMKTEFLVQLDGAATGDEDRILIIGATNRPQELDEAARRRFVKRLYIPLPEKQARLEIIKRLMASERNELNQVDMEQVADLAAGYSGADMKNLCSEASLGPIRSIDISLMQNIQPDQVRSITMDDFRSALNRVRASVSPADLDQYIVWDRTYGVGGW